VSRGRTVLFGTGALLALLVGGIVAPGVAQASCGDHVQVRLPVGVSPSAEPPAPQPPAVPPAPAKPCHGPQCSGGGSPPLLPPPATSAPTADEHWAQAACPDTVPAPGHPERFSKSSSDHPIRRTADVFHPPRLS